MPLDTKLTLNFESGKSKQYVDENQLYNPDGIKIFYGYKDGQKKYIYGDNINEGYGGIEQSGGLHGIHLSRALNEGEEVVVHWRNGYDLIFFWENGETKVKKRTGGSYQEVGKWADENGYSEYTSFKFNDDISKKRFDYIETKNFKEF